MRLDTVFARFYKSFNFDHLRKAHPEAQPKVWEMYEDEWYPYIEVPIDERTTAIVGSNESGKSHLLGAIKKAITGKDFEQKDLCRYSDFFNVEKGKTCWPHLGVAWRDLDTQERAQLKVDFGEGAPEAADRFMMFREGPESLTVYIPDTGGEFLKRTFTGEGAENFGRTFLPVPFEIKADVALPNYIPLDRLGEPSSTTQAPMSRKARANYVHAGAAILPFWNSNPEQLVKFVPQITSVANGFFARVKAATVTDNEYDEEASRLARGLLIEIASVEPARLSDLSNAIENGDDGHANALIARINEQLARRMNFPKWWAQDRDFAIQVTSRELELVFTIKDRTGTEYTFKERSSGLKYFLSYLIQSRIHRRNESRAEILLMDEPDAFLSAEAQQDLLKIFADFAEPADDRRPIQVIYVTHSPFLLDKNHAERIRVLQKGKGRDGTRVIRNASKNHYEPLRSAFGAFVGETAFVGACNLLVEGVADQVLLAGFARLTRRHTGGLEGENLDLNRMVIVPCGSASQVPYMLYLIRGRDAERPPVITLLDSDKAGNEAAALLRNDKKLRHLIAQELVLQLAGLHLFDGSEPDRVTFEDLLPAEIALAAANACIAETMRFREGEIGVLALDELLAARTEYVPMLDALNQISSAKGVHIEKIAFARAVVDLVEREGDGMQPHLVALVGRVRRLFKAINAAKRKAERDAARERIGAIVDRLQVIFVRDNPMGATKERGALLVDQIEENLDDSNESDDLRVALGKLRKEFSMDEEQSEAISSYDVFKARLASLKDAFHIARIEPSSIK